MRGSNFPGACVAASRWTSGIGENSLDLFKDLFVFKQVLTDQSRRAGRDASPATLAEDFVDAGLLFVRVESDGLVRAERHAGLAPAALLFEDISRVRLHLHVPRVDQGQGLGGG